MRFELDGAGGSSLGRHKSRHRGGLLLMAGLGDAFDAQPLSDDPFRPTPATLGPFYLAGSGRLGRWAPFMAGFLLLLLQSWPLFNLGRGAGPLIFLFLGISVEVGPFAVVGLAAIRSSR